MEQAHVCDELIGREVPWFVRESSHGLVCSRDPSGNHPRLLVFCPALDSPECRAYLARIESDRAEYDRLQAEVVLIAAADQPAPALSFAVVSGARDLFEQFGMVGDQGEPRAGVAAVDRYGAVDSCAVGATTADFPEEQVVAARLSSAENACPECGVAEAQWAETTEYGSVVGATAGDEA